MKKINQNGFAHPMALLVIVGFIAVTGFAGYRVSQADNESVPLNSSSQSARIDQVLPVTLDAVKPVSDIQTAVAAGNASAVSGVQLKVKNGVLVYEVSLADGTRLTLNAESGAAIKTEKGEAPDSGGALPVGFSAAINLEAARKIAHERFPESKIWRIHLESQEGMVVYSVRFLDNARVNVDANTGEIVRTKEPKGVRAAEKKPLGNPSETKSKRSSTPAEAKKAEGTAGPGAGEVNRERHSNGGSDSSNSGRGGDRHDDSRDDVSPDREESNDSSGSSDDN